MRNSQYLNSYLSENAQRGAGKGLTAGSFLAYQLRGTAKKYSGKYLIALKNSCKRVGAVVGESKLGRVAYYPAN